MANRASGDAFDKLHSLVTNELIARIESGEATTADLKAAADWLAKNDITGVPVVGSPLASLADMALPELDFSQYNKGG